MTINSDHPIESSSQDRLGRVRIGEHIAKQILGASREASFVISIQGPWGCGKSSLLNLISEHLHEKVTLVRFNPWLFSGTDQLLSRYFRELSLELSGGKEERLQSLCQALDTYAGSLSSLLSNVPAIDPYTGLAKVLVSAARWVLKKLGTPKSLDELRRSLRDQFQNLDRKVVVFIDDLDRMSKEEVKDIVRLVRLVGDFPNLVYVLAFDADRVAGLLGENVESGRAYLQKIVQIAHDVPIARPTDLDQMCFQVMDEAIQGASVRELDQNAWSNLWALVVRPLMSTPRDINRFGNALDVTLGSIGREVALADLLSLEAVRVLRPKVFASLREAKDALTSATIEKATADSSDAKSIQAIPKSDEEHREWVEEMVGLLFPAAAEGHLQVRLLASRNKTEWALNRRVALAEVFLTYLQHTLPEGEIETEFVEKAVSTMKNHEAVSALLTEMDDQRMEILFRRMEAYELNFQPDQVQPALCALLDQAHRLREDKTSFFGGTGDQALNRVIYRLLKCVVDDEERTKLIQNTLPTLLWISGKWTLVIVARESKFITELKAEELLNGIYLEIQNSDSLRLSQEPQLYRLIINATASNIALHARVQDFALDDGFLFQLLRTGMSDGARQSLGSVQVEIFSALPWEELGNLLGEKTLVERVKSGASSWDSLALHPRTLKALKLAERYIEGWRPSRF
ncbi:MAG: AAA family ATPase [Holophagaceae bacterium]|nr:AAA family ATPase [Holophagaceae bacterium]